MPRVQLNQWLFVASLLVTALTAATSIGGSVLYILLYLGAFVALTPQNHEDTVTYWDDHAEKNMFTVFVCLEMFVTRAWALCECLRVLRTEALGSAIEQRNWALTCMWLAVGVGLGVDVVTHSFIYSMPNICNNLAEQEHRKQRSLAPLCAQSNENQLLVHTLHYVNAACLVAAALCITLDTITQIRQLKQDSRVLDLIQEEMIQKYASNAKKSDKGENI